MQFENSSRVVRKGRYMQDGGGVALLSPCRCLCLVRGETREWLTSQRARCGTSPLKVVVCILYTRYNMFCRIRQVLLLAPGWLRTRYVEKREAPQPLRPRRHHTAVLVHSSLRIYTFFKKNDPRSSVTTSECCTTQREHTWYY